MNIEDQVDNIISNLKVISMVQKNGRLCVRKGSLTIEPDDNIQKFRRWFFKDGREITMMHVKNTVYNAIKLAKGIITGQLEVDMREWALQRICKEMTNCQSGIINLKTTYNDDSIMIANLDVLLERLQANCLEIHDELAKFDKPDTETNTQKDAPKENTVRPRVPGGK